VSLLRDVASFAARKRDFGIIEGCQEFRSLALALFPQQQCLLNRILGTVKPAGFDGLANQCLLVGRQTYFHAHKRKRLRSKCQASPAASEELSGNGEFVVGLGFVDRLDRGAGTRKGGLYLDRSARSAVALRAIKRKLLELASDLTAVNSARAAETWPNLKAISP